MPAPPDDNLYFVDDFGYLWRGSLQRGGPGRQFEWQRFDGVRKGGKQIWEWADPVTGLALISSERAKRMIARFVAEEG